MRRMDFLYLILIYLIIFIIGSLALLYRDATILNTGPIGVLRNLFEEAFGRVVPSSVQSILYRIGNRLLFERTCFFQVIYIALCLLAHVVWLVDLIPILMKHHPHENHTFWPFVAIFVNYYFLHKAWITDPGVITKTSIQEYQSIYEYDGVLYTEGSMCSTCKLVKPARSKHCSVCNRCVHRFDHHCIWTNNCVGAHTQRYFIMFMVTLVAGFAQGIYVTTGCIVDYANDIRLFNASYVEDDGTIKPVTLSVGFQHLFMALPRVVFLLLAVSVLTFLVTVFMCHHIYLVLTNQTTNETHKLKAIRGKRKDNQKTSGDASTKNSSKSKKTPLNRKLPYRPYSRGALQNLKEVFLPSSFIQERLKTV